MHTSDGEKFGVKDGDIVKIKTRRHQVSGI